MRYSPAHAAKSGSVPFTLRGPKSVRTILSAAVAGAIAFAPALLVTSPAQAAPLTGFTFADPTIVGNEGDDLTFELVRDTNGSSLPAVNNLTWSISTGGAPGDPVADVDYTNVTAEAISFPADNTNPYGGDSVFLTVDSLEDVLDENTETFTVTVTDGTDTLTAEGRITDDDDAPGYTLVVNDSSPSEDIAAGEVTVTAELDEVSGKAVTIPISTTAGTAKAAQDYTTTSGTITIAAGDTTTLTTVDVPIIDDPLYEENQQTFQVKAGSSSTVTGQETATVTITDDEDQSEVEISPDTVAEGGTLAFGVTLSPASERSVTATWTTADGPGSDAPNSTHGTAKAGSDYTGGTGTVTFPGAAGNSPGVSATNQTVNVKTIGDSINEATEDLHVTLSNAAVGTLGDDTVATGAITDNDTIPTATLSPTAAITEGSAGRSAKTYTVKLNRESGQTVTVDYAAAPTGVNPATAVADFFPASGTLTFQPGETMKTFTVDVVGDTIDEPNETFAIGLNSSTANVTASTTITITDDDATPTFSVAPMTMDEGDTGSVVVFPVRLSNPSSEDTVFTVADNPGTATATGTDPGDIDYLEPTSPLTIPAGQTVGYVYFLANGDEVFETNESMTVELTPTSLNLASATAKTAALTLNNDDDAPSFEVMSATGTEGSTVDVMGIVTGVAQADTVFNINFAGSSVNGTAAASANDFTNPGTVPVTVLGGTLSGSPVPVTSLQLTEDTTPEGPESILATGNAVNGAVVNGVVTIAASDGGAPAPAPTLTSSAAFRLGAGSLRLSGTATAGATVTLWGTPIGADADKPWQQLGTITANASGAYSFFPQFTTTGWWFRTTVGDQQSNAIKVNLKEDPDFSVRSSSKGTATLTVVGDPKVRGLAVRVMRANSNGTWSTVGTGILNSSGVYSKTLTGLKSGASYLYRATVYGDGDVGLLTNTSASARVRVR